MQSMTQGGGFGRQLIGVISGVERVANPAYTPARNEQYRTPHYLERVTYRYQFMLQADKRNGARQPEPPQRSDCGSFAETLTNYALTQDDFANGITAVDRGRQMMIAASRLQDLGEKKGKAQHIGGFRAGLADHPQQGDVYKHIYAHAGAMMIGNSYVLGQPFVGSAWVKAGETGYGLSIRQFSEDYLDSQGGRDGKHSRLEGLIELSDDRAGRRIGGLMSDALIRNQRDHNQLRNKIFDVICDH